MKCGCLELIENKIKEHAKAKKPLLEKVSFDNIVLNFESGQCELTIPLTITYKKKEGGKDFQEHASMHMNYCPFCGKSLSEKEKQNSEDN